MIMMKFTRDQTDLMYDMMSLERFNVSREQFYLGCNVELEHGSIHPLTNITGDDMVITAKIALAHLLYEDPKYYTKLKSVGL
jgi:hypothetical protein